MKKLTFQNGMEIEIERVASGLSLRLAVPETLRDRTVKLVGAFVQRLQIFPGVGAAPVLSNILRVVALADEVGKEPPPP